MSNKENLVWVIFWVVVIHGIAALYQKRIDVQCPVVLYGLQGAKLGDHVLHYLSTPALALLTVGT